MKETSGALLPLGRTEEELGNIRRSRGRRVRLSPQVTEKIAFGLLSLAALTIILPVGIILGVILIQGLPALNWGFLTEAPRMGMKEG
ncbi:MAG: hypothetical protein QHH30_10080, partial [candidate division NC10 bacterium]|nr:hypothetical protein [candidate division NC10 bacterium]